MPCDSGTPHKFVLRYDQESGREGVAMLADLFDEGWETLTPLHFAADGFYATTLYWPTEQPNK
jgi:hypothetical protein